MRKAFFRKISPGFITLKINGVPTKIKQGELFEHYFEIVNGLPGIQFVCFANENYQPPQPEQNQTLSNALTTYQETPQQNEQITEEHHKEITEHTNENNNNSDTLNEIEKEQQEYKKDNQFSISEQHIEILKQLKQKSQKELFTMKKKDIEQILTNCNIDFSHIKDNRIELYKFLVSLLSKIN